MYEGNPKPSEDRGHGGLSGGPAVSLGTNMAVGMLLFVGLGYWLDHRRGGGMAWTLAGLAVGTLYGGYELWKAVRSLQGPPGGRGGAPRPPADGGPAT